jgi:hypothetical protein
LLRVDGDNADGNDRTDDRTVVRRQNRRSFPSPQTEIEKKARASAKPGGGVFLELERESGDDDEDDDDDDDDPDDDPDDGDAHGGNDGDGLLARRRSPTRCRSKSRKIHSQQQNMRPCCLLFVVRFLLFFSVGKLTVRMTAGTHIDF